MGVSGARLTIEKEILTWPGTTKHPHRFGGTEFRLGSRELGHIHGDWLVDIPFPRKIRDEIVGSGRAQPHHILPQSGWVSCTIREEGDIARVIELLRVSYDLAVQQKKRRENQESGGENA